MAKSKGHARGTSFSKKQYDKKNKRNYYAKELYDTPKYKQRIITREKNRLLTKREFLELFNTDQVESIYADILEEVEDAKD